jgi:ABC-2 type transport system permease protein
VVFGLAIGVILLGLNLGDTNFLLLSAAIAAATISTSGLGLMLGSLSLVTVNIFFINNVMYFLLLLFSGANIPRGDMPAWMATVGDFLPLTRAITAARRIVDGGSFNAVSGLLATELLIGIAYAAFGFLIFRWIEFQARQRGTIDRM